MADNVNDSGQFGWVKLWHPRGPAVNLPISTALPMHAAGWRMMLDSVSAALEAGFLVTAPGLEEGEIEEKIGWVLRTAFERDGEVTPCLLLYSADEHLTFSILRVYLDSDEEVAAFEWASKISLKAMPEYDGADKPERGRSSKLDRYFVKPPRPFGVILCNNRKYDEATRAATVAKGEVYKVARRLFVRWADQRPAAAPTTQPASAPPTPAAPSAPQAGNGTPTKPPAPSALPGDVDAITENQWTLLCAELARHLIAPEAFLRRYRKTCWQEITATGFDQALAAAKAPDDELRAAQRALPTRINEAQWNTICAALERSKVGVEAFLRWTGYTSSTLLRVDDFDRCLRAAQNPPSELRRPAANAGATGGTGATGTAGARK